MIRTFSNVKLEPKSGGRATRPRVALTVERQDSPVQIPRQGLVGIVTNRFDSPYYGRMVHHASEYLLQRGYHSIVQANARCKSGELEAWFSLEACDCDAIILHSDMLGDAELSELMYRHEKVVLLNRYLQHFDDRCVYVDNVKGGAVAAQHLIDMGHTRIAMVTGPNRFFEVSERTAGFMQAIENFGAAEPPLIIESDFSANGGADAIKKIASHSAAYTGVFFQNDDMAVGALDRCWELGLAVPEELSIIGFDDLAPRELTSTKLTSVRQPLRRIGKAAAKVVHKMLTQEATVAEDLAAHYFIPELVERDSVAPISAKADKPILSEREIECLTWTAKGKTSWEISKILGVSESTICFHLRSTSKKLESNNRTHSVAMAYKMGLINL